MTSILFPRLGLWLQIDLQEKPVLWGWFWEGVSVKKILGLMGAETQLYLFILNRSFISFFFFLCSVNHCVVHH